MRKFHLSLIMLLSFCVQNLYAQSTASKRKSNENTSQSSAIDETDFRSLALSENKIDDTAKKALPVEAQVEGLLKLKDPKIEARDRYWDYYFKVSVQSSKPQGVGENDFNQKFDLDKNSSVAMPAVELGAIYLLTSNELTNVKLSLGGSLAYTSQKANAEFQSGLTVDDAHINTMIIKATPQLHIAVPYWNQAVLVLGGEYGLLNYTQSSTNDLASFSKNANVTAWTIGADYYLSKNLSFGAQYAERNLINNNQKIAISKENIEIGTRVQW